MVIVFVIWNVLFMTLNNFIREAAGISLKLKARNASKKRIFKHKKWFYFTLKEIKASLIACSKNLLLSILIRS